MLSQVNQYLDHTTGHVIIKTHRADLPELIHHVAQFVLRARGHPSSCQDKFLVLCCKLVRFKKNLVQHMETWLDQVTPPWTSYTQPDIKRCSLESSLDTEMMATCYWLLKSCSGCRACGPGLTSSFLWSVDGCEGEDSRWM